MMKNRSTSRLMMLTASSALAILLGVSSGGVLASTTYNNGTVTEQSATVNGKTLTITFSGNLQSTMVDINEFTVQDGNNTDWVFDGSINGNTLTLTLGSEVTAGDAVTVSYSPSGFYDLTDSSGNKIAAFSNVTATNTTPSSQTATNQNTSPAALVSIGVTGVGLTNMNTMTVTFSGNLQSNNVDTSAFTVTDNNMSDAVSNAVISGNTLTLNLQNAISSYDDSVSVSYSPSGTNDLMDSSGNQVAAFSKNLTPPPLTVPSKFEINGNDLTILFNNGLNEHDVVNPNVFTVMVGNQPDAVISDKVSSSTSLTLMLKNPVASGDIVTVSYQPTNSNYLSSKSGVTISGFSNQAVTNITKSDTVNLSQNPSLYNGTWRLVGASPYLTGSGKHYSDQSNNVTTLTTYDGFLYAGTKDGVYAFYSGAWHLMGSSRYLITGALIPYDKTLVATFAYQGVAFYDKGKWYQVGASQNMNAGSLLVFKNQLYTGTDKGVYVLRNNGSWSAVGSSAKLTWAGMLADINGQLYTAASQNDVGRVFGYHNGSWQTVGQLGSYFSPIDVHTLVSYKNVVYAATDTGVYAHAAGTWDLATQGTWNNVGLDHKDVRTLLIMNGTMFAATIHGVYAYVNGSWQQVGASFYQKIGYGAAADVFSLVNIKGVLYAGTSYGVYAYSNR